MLEVSLSKHDARVVLLHDELDCMKIEEHQCYRKVHLTGLVAAYGLFTLVRAVTDFFGGDVFANVIVVVRDYAWAPLFLDRLGRVVFDSLSTDTVD
jgi:hypothetical protein